MSYYNTSAPDPTTKNTINGITINYGIRDFLLHRNIQNPIRYPQLSTTINGSPKGGEPVLDTMVGNGNVNQQIGIEDDSTLRYSNAILMNKYKNDSSNATDLINIETNLPNSNNNGISSYSTSTNNSQLLNNNTFRKQNTIKNLYLDSDKQVDIGDYISLQPQGFTSQNKGYLDTYGAVNIAGRGSNITDIIGTIISGQGVGLGSQGPVSNFDIRSSIIGRTLAATGLINDTRLGMIGGQQLVLALSNNILFNTQQETIGHVNLDPIDLIRGGSFIRPNYRITVGNNGTLNTFERILGFDVPISQLDDSGSIFSTENGGISNILRANNMLNNTGKGQQQAFVSQFKATSNGTGFGDSPNDSPFRTGYVAGYKINNKFIIDGNPLVYAYGDAEGMIENFLSNKEIIPSISYQRDIEKYGFISTNDDYSTSTIMRPTFSWGSDVNNAVNTNKESYQLDITKKISLLSKTQKLFNSIGMKSIVSSKGIMGMKPSQINTSVVGGGISKGNAVKTAKALNSVLNTAEETYCRSWTTYDRYDRVNKLIRHQGLNQDNSGNTVMSQTDGWRRHTENSVLDNNGFVKIGPYKGEAQNKLTAGGADPKRYMLSIENLAWDGKAAQHLLGVEQGPGDLLSGKFGRIMWFPPYEIAFTENNTASWESTNFIGRGEPVYTYNNAERTGTLSFKLVVDHPSQINGFAGSNGPMDDEIDSYFAGCKTIGKQWLDKLTHSEASAIEQNKTETPVKVSIEKEIAPPPFSVYFLNDVTEVRSDYEDGSCPTCGVGTYTTEPQTHNGIKRPSRTLIDNTNFGLNAQPIVLNGVTYDDGWINPSFQEALKRHLIEKCPHCRIDIYGYASSQGWADANQALSDNRANNFYKWIQDNILEKSDKFYENRKKVIKGKGALAGTGTKGMPTDAKLPKSGRKIDIRFVPDSNLQADKPVKESIVTKTVTKPVTKRVNKKIINRYYSEASFFEQLTQDDPFVFDSIREKLRYFHPAFHSTTPEGFNARLTFLNQCVRQGPTDDGINPRNLAFGAPPICILRIGDFYNTKIVIDNIGYDFEPLLWDINPEGVGVQPMIAKVNIYFKFIGGSSLRSPINKLQNALSFNYFANSQVYDARADYVALDKADNSDSGKIPKGSIKSDIDIIETDMLPTEVSRTEELISTVTSTSPEVEMDQIASADASSSGIENQETPEDQNTVDEINKYAHLINVDTNDDTITLNVSIDRALSKSYSYKVKLIDSTGINVTEIGAGELTGDLFQKPSYSGFNNKLISGNNYTIQVCFNDTTNRLTKTFTA